MSWTDKQLECIECHGGSMLVSAAAGSGKTTVLVERILTRIVSEENPLSLDRLLVVTFTKAAAAEMRGRLAKKLAERAAEDPDNLRLQQQQLLLPRADICTIDSFCATLVRENFAQLGVSPQFKIADTQQLLLLSKEALKETLAEFYGKGDPDFAQLVTRLSNGKNDNHLLQAVDALYNFIQSYPHPDRWLDETAALYDFTCGIADTVWGKAVLRHVADQLQQGERLYEQAIWYCSADKVLSQKPAAALHADADALHQLQQLALDGEWDKLWVGLAAFKQEPLGGTKDALDQDSAARAKELREDVKDKIIKKLLDSACGDEVTCLDNLARCRNLIRVLYAVVRRYEQVLLQKKREQNLTDFAEVEHLALSLLTEFDEQGNLVPTAFAEELSERYDEILVDEYQDTNAVQEALFIALSKQQSNLFFVGDVKQSIYGFRKAMPELFLDRRNRYPTFDKEHYPGTVTLANNFRSRRQVTEAVNYVFRQLMTAAVGDIDYDENEELVCSATYPQDPDPSPYATECLILDGTLYANSDLEKDQAEAEIIARRILELVDSKLDIVDGKSTRPIRFSDCCILLRSRESHAAAYCQMLQKYGIPAVTQTGSGFFAAAEVRLALSLLRCIDNPLQDVPLGAAMLSPVFGFTPDDLAQIRLFRPEVPLYVAVQAARRHPDAVLAGRCTHLLSTLDRYRKLSAVMTVDRLVNRLYEDLALPELLDARLSGSSRAENLRQLYELCVGFEQRGFRGLSAFVRHIDRLQEQGEDLPAASGSEENAVRIMSIHGSKGLEFPVVFLAGLCVQFNNEDSRADLLMHAKYGAAMNLRDPDTYAKQLTVARQGLLLMRRNDERAEALRVLYVAMTRAREKLILVMNVREPQTLLERLFVSLDPASPTLPPRMIRDANSLGEWILAVLLRHPDGTPLRALTPGAVNCENLIIEPPAEEGKPAPAPWIVRLVSPPTPLPQKAAPSAPPADPEQMRAISERIAYTYPHEALSRVPTKMAASALTADPTRPELVAHARPSFLSKSGLTPAERGTAMHAFMQYADYAAAAASVEDEAKRLAAQGFLSEEAAASLDVARLRAFFDGALYARMTRAERVLREYHFTAEQPASLFDPTVTDPNEITVIQGIADCVFVENGELVIVDYKTDRVKDPAVLAERYAAQLNVYARALSTVLELPVRECVLYSFALGRTVTL